MPNTISAPASSRDRTTDAAPVTFSTMRGAGGTVGTADGVGTGVPAAAGGVCGVGVVCGTTAGRPSAMRLCVIVTFFSGLLCGAGRGCCLALVLVVLSVVCGSAGPAAVIQTTKNPSSPGVTKGLRVFAGRRRRAR